MRYILIIILSKALLILSYLLATTQNHGFIFANKDIYAIIPDKQNVTITQSIYLLYQICFCSKMRLIIVV